MAKRSKPEIISARVTLQEKAELELLATAEGKTVSQLIWELAVPVCRERLLAGLALKVQASDQRQRSGPVGKNTMLDQQR